MHQHKIKCVFGGPKEEESASTEKVTHDIQEIKIQIINLH